jgi:hypothetical protein
VRDTAVPFGCPPARSLPLPAHALEADYRRYGERVVAVRLRFADSHQAARFQRARLANLRACRGRVSSPAEGPLVEAVRVVGEDVVVSDRTPRSDLWGELAVLDEADVVLVALHATVPDRAQAHAWAKAFRADHETGEAP